MNLDYLFVYGTLRRDTNSRMHRFLARHAEYVDEATYQGKLYQIDYYPGALPSAKAEDKVYGEVYLIRNAHAVFEVLDRYEQCSPEFSEPHEYIRRKQTVLLSNGDTVNAWIYLYNHSIAGRQGINAKLASWVLLSGSCIKVPLN